MLLPIANLLTKIRAGTATGAEAQNAEAMFTKAGTLESST